MTSFKTEFTIIQKYYFLCNILIFIGYAAQLLFYRQFVYAAFMNDFKCI